MTEKKYQIFISSTYEDLKSERDMAIKTILCMEQIPIGMEMFNAGDESQWELIKQTIDRTDYYIVIIGFRYGSVDSDGVGFTEKEYDYAVSKGIPVIAFIKGHLYKHSVTKSAVDIIMEATAGRVKQDEAA